MKPILFNTQMVNAILAGNKTCTRRIIKDISCLPNKYEFLGFCNYDKDGYCARFRFKHFFGDLPWLTKVKVPYKEDDVLYVRETWGISNPLGDYAKGNMTAEYIYKAGYAKGERVSIGRTDEKNLGKWRPSIHMPKAAARLFLKVTSVKIERLQDITEDGVKAEGIKPRFDVKDKFSKEIAIQRFRELWDSTVNKKDMDMYGFDSNPWVWVIEFKRINKEELINE